jgi:hypothetical protein
MTRPRIRSLKPEMWHDEAFGALTPQARLLFIGLITMADDEGRLRDLPAAIVGHVFPYDAVPAAKVDRWLQELEHAGLIVRYDVGAHSYIWLRSWAKHQRINRPTPSRLPQPPFNESSLNGHGAVTERSSPRARACAGADQDLDRNPPNPPTGEDDVAGGLDQAQDRIKTAAIERIFDAWVAAAGKDANRTVLDDKRRRLIRRALERYPTDDVIAAVRGWRHSPHHRGENTTNTVYNDLGLLLRDGDHIERFRDLERNGPATPASTGDAYAALEAAYTGVSNDPGEEPDW